MLVHPLVIGFLASGHPENHRPLGPASGHDTDHSFPRGRPRREASFRRETHIVTDTWSEKILMKGPCAVPEKSFRAQRLYHVDAGGACGWEHRSDYRRA